MAFKFRYESLLVYRNHLKEKAEMNLARAIRALKVSEQTLADLAQDRMRAAAKLEADLARPMDARLMRSYLDYLEHMADKIQNQVGELATRETAVQQERSHLLQRTKACRIMENLKEKDRAKWKLELERKEQIRLSEIAVLRHRRGQL